MKTKYKTWRLGNLLRGYESFKARNIKEAWKIGCRMFNKALPSKSKAGRQVELYLFEETITTKTYPNKEHYVLKVVGYSKEVLA